MSEEIFNIAIPITSRIDIYLFKYIIEQGVDSRLTAFTKSKFYMKEDRLRLDFHVSELEILIRRLLEYPDTEDESADTWADTIVSIQYGHDAI